MHTGGAPSILTGTGPSTPVTSSPSTTSPAKPPTGAASSAVGTAEQYGYGVLAVKVTVQEDASQTFLPRSFRQQSNTPSRSLNRSYQCFRNEILSAQSAHINAISGATYTSEAYAYSVQSALDALGVK